MRVRQLNTTKRGIGWRLALVATMVLMMLSTMLVAPSAIAAVQSPDQQIDDQGAQVDPPPVTSSIFIRPTGDFLKGAPVTKPAGSADHYTLVTDGIANTFVGTKAELLTAWYNEVFKHDFDQNYPYPDGNIVSVIIHAKMRTFLTYKAVKPVIHDGFDMQFGDVVKVTGFFGIWYDYQMDITDLQGWTWPKVKNTKFGVSMNSALFSVVECSELYVEVIYAPTADPSVTTDAADGIGQTGATLNGSLDNLGSATSVDVSFCYGETTAYGNETTAQTMDATGDFTADLAGLSPGTEYHFRAKGEGEGTGYGADRTLTTIAPQVPAASTTGASDVGGTSATLSGNLDSLGELADVDVWFEWGTDTSYGNTTPAQNMSATGPFSAIIDGLSTGTEYHFRATVGSGGASGGDMSFTTITPSGAPDSVLVATPLSGAVTINGAPAANGTEVRVLVASETESRQTGTAATSGGTYELLLVGNVADVGQSLPVRLPVSIATRQDKKYLLLQPRIQIGNWKAGVAMPVVRIQLYPLPWTATRASLLPSVRKAPRVACP